MRTMIQLNYNHWDARVEWCGNHAHSRNEWNHVIFIDDKKFDADDPNGHEQVWHDHQLEKSTFFSRHCDGRGGIMWSEFQ